MLCVAGVGSSATAAPSVGGGSCRKEQSRDYYVENGCRSRKPLKLARCEGACPSAAVTATPVGAAPGAAPGGCCRVRKSKRRRVRLVCNDGTRYVRDLDAVRKCGCSKKCF
jgi:slit 2